MDFIGFRMVFLAEDVGHGSHSTASFLVNDSVHRRQHFESQGTFQQIIKILMIKILY